MIRTTAHAFVRPHTVHGATLIFFNTSSFQCRFLLTLSSSLSLTPTVWQWCLYNIETDKLIIKLCVVCVYESQWH